MKIKVHVGETYGPYKVSPAKETDSGVILDVSNKTYASWNEAFVLVDKILNKLYKEIDAEHSKQRGN